MNIQLLTPKFLRNDIITRSNQNGVNANTASYPNLRPLEKDTVSFGAKTRFILDSADEMQSIAKTKILGQWDNNGVSFQDIRDIAQSFEQPLGKFIRELKAAMKDLIATDAKPNNPIMPGVRGIKGRVKKPASIAEKANSRKLFTIEEIEKMGDVGGARIVMRSATQDDIALVFEALGSMVKKGAKIKEVEDFFYKWRCGEGNKKFDSKYKPIQAVFERFMPTLDDFQKETLTRYIKDSYEHALAMPATSAKRRPNYEKDYFLPFPYSLPQELSYVNLHRMMEECNVATKKK